MAKRMTDTDIWDKEWFMDLSLKHKHIVRYLFDKCDLAGVYKPNYKLMSLQIGEPCSFEDINSLPKKQFKFFKDKVIVLDFIEFQNGTLGNKSPVHLKILSMLKAYGIKYPINRVSDTLIVEVEVGVKEEVKVNDFQVLIDKWLNYKKQRRESYAGKDSIDVFEKHLREFSKNDYKTAEKIIEQSMANNWAGIFELKNKGNLQQTGMIR